MPDPNREIDKSHLSATLAAERDVIHRDLISHNFRWTHVAKKLHERNRYKNVHILDVGCGKEMPLARLLYSNRLLPVNGSYTGVDANKLELPKMLEPAAKRFPIFLHGKKAFPNVELERDRYDIIVCFEVAEHITPFHAFKLLRGIRELLAKEGEAFISTPNYDASVGA